MNKITSNLHTHTHYSDGRGNPEDFVLAALEKGYHAIGFSEHAYNSYDLECRISLEEFPLYKAELRALGEKYAGRIQIYCGIENDYFEPMPAENFDFTIGSSHFVRSGNGQYHCLDNCPQLFQQAADAFGGVPALLERYYSQVADIAIRQKPDIVGHLDLITKFNTHQEFFRPDAPYYRRLTRMVSEEIARSGCIVEVNSGGMCRGYTARPYPGQEILLTLLRLEVPVTLAADAHSVEGLGHYFDEMAAMLWEIGYRSTRQLRDGGFVDIPLEP